MQFPDFALERWLLQPSEIDLAGAGITRLRISDVCDGLDPDTLLSYGRTDGSELLRERVAALYPGASATMVLATTGTSEANFLAIYRLLEPASQVVAMNPTYMQHRGLAASLGAELRICELREEEGYRIDLGRLADLVTAKTELITLVNPNNPTGIVITSSEMREVCRIAERVGAWVLADGALRGTEISGQLAPTPIEFYERGIATGSLTKLGMPGLRVGWLIANAQLVRECWALKDYTTLSHSGIGELIATEALHPENIARFQARARQRVAEHSAIVGAAVTGSGGMLKWVPPEAGHTCFPAYELDADSEKLCRRLLDETGVLLTPGDYFHSSRHVRLRTGADRSALEEGLQRIGRFLSGLRQEWQAARSESGSS